MKKQTTVSARVDEELKIDAEEILSELGVSLSSSIAMFLKQVVLNKGLPFAVTLNKPIDMSNLSKEEFDYEMQKAFDDLKNGRYSYSLDDKMNGAELLVSEEDSIKKYGK